MKNMIVLFLLTAQILQAQSLPDIKIGPVDLSEGEINGLTLTLGGVTPDMVLEEWKAFTYLMFPPVQPGEDRPRMPQTIEAEADTNEYHTSGIYLPNLSQNTFEAYLTIESADLPDVPSRAEPATTISMVIDFGNGNFLNTDDFYQVGAIKHMLYRFYYYIEQSQGK